LTSHVQAGGHDVIPRIKVLPPGGSIRSVCRRPCCSSVSSWSMLHSSYLRL